MRVAPEVALPKPVALRKPRQPSPRLSPTAKALAGHQVDEMSSAAHGGRRDGPTPTRQGDSRLIQKHVRQCRPSLKANGTSSGAKGAFLALRWGLSVLLGGQPL
jgi:hypothetical protein